MRCDMNAMGGVRCARASGDEANPRPPGKASLRQRHYRSACLLTADDDFERRIRHRIKGREIRLTGDAINRLRPLREKLIDEDLSPSARSPSVHRRVFSRKKSD